MLESFQRPALLSLPTTPKFFDFGGDEAIRKSEWEAVFEDFESQVSIMPRIGVSFPVTDESLFFGSYGIVRQRPSKGNYASLARMLNRSANGHPNPDLKPEQTVEYEIGFRQRVTDRIAITIAGFFRQIKDVETHRLVENSWPVEYSTSQNIDFGTVKGVELNFDVRRIRNLSMNANYTLSLAEGTGSRVPTSRWNTSNFDDPIRTIFPLGFDQRHRMNLSLDLRFGDNEGPTFVGIRLLEHVGVNVLVQATSGFPYTARALEDQSDTASQVTRPLGKINSHRMPSSSRIDVRIDRAIRLRAGTTLSVFAWIQNLLDVKNVYGVYPSTGLPDEDGWLDSPDGVAYLDSQLRPETAEIVETHQIRNPVHFGIPRLIRIGARLTF